KLFQMKRLQTLLLIMFCGTLSIAQQTPASKQTKTIAIMGATAHIGNGEVIENSLIIFKDGKLQNVVDATIVKMDLSGRDVMHGDGEHVYPGVIVADCTLGLVEIEAVRATDDQDAIGNMDPHLRSLTAYYAESKLVGAMRPGAVLLGQR